MKNEFYFTIDEMVNHLKESVPLMAYVYPFDVVEKETGDKYEFALTIYPLVEHRVRYIEGYLQCSSSLVRNLKYRFQFSTIYGDEVKKNTKCNIILSFIYPIYLINKIIILVYIGKFVCAPAGKVRLPSKGEKRCIHLQKYLMHSSWLANFANDDTATFHLEVCSRLVEPPNGDFFWITEMTIILSPLA